MGATSEATQGLILDAAEAVVREEGIAGVSTRRVADLAGVPLSQIHYHFGSKRQLLLAVLQHQDRHLLARQEQMYADDAPLWKQWEQACDFYDADLASGYVRVLQEMVAAGWTDPEIAAAVRALLRRWTDLLREVAERAESTFGGFGVLTGADVGTLVSLLWLGAESMQLLGMEDDTFDIRGALRRFGQLLRDAEDVAVGA